MGVASADLLSCDSVYIYDTQYTYLVEQDSVLSHTDIHQAVDLVGKKLNEWSLYQQSSRPLKSNASESETIQT